MSPSPSQSDSESLSTSKNDMIELKKIFSQNGFAKINNFCAPKMIEKLKVKVCELVENFDLSNHPISIFTTFDSNEKKRGSDDYFMTSADKIHYFMEDNVIDPISKKLKVPKDQCLNKIGHAVHCLVPEFKELTFSDDIKYIAKSLGFVDPVVVQSMIIFKNARVGGAVGAHQDCSYLHCLPESAGTVLGFWIPLDDATLENGCLQFAAGSHKRYMTPNTRWTRVIDPETNRIYMKHTEPNVDYSDESLIPLPAKSGDCLLIDGLVVHASEPNYSDKARWAYTFHCYDRHKGIWDTSNWLQPTSNGTFTSLYN